jgi:hypothetical protein
MRIVMMKVTRFLVLDMGLEVDLNLPNNFKS